MLLIELLIPGDKVFQFLQQLGAKSRELSVLDAGVGRQRGIVDVVAGIASRSDHYDLVDLVEKQNRVQKRKHLQKKKTNHNYFILERELGFRRERKRKYVREELGERERRSAPEERVCVQ